MNVLGKYISANIKKISETWVNFSIVGCVFFLNVNWAVGIADVVMYALCSWKVPYVVIFITWYSCMYVQLSLY